MLNTFDQGATLKPKRWTQKMALDLTASMEPFLKPLGYQVLLGGSVLTKGRSDKNLNLYFMPAGEPGSIRIDDMGLITWLASFLGKSVGTRAVAPPRAGIPLSTYLHYIEFNFDGLPIAVRIGR